MMVKPHAESGEELAEPRMNQAWGYRPNDRLFTSATTYNRLQYRRNVFEKIELYSSSVKLGGYLKKRVAF
jgi:hypothetical protein